jgi:hypothetical protein
MRRHSLYVFGLISFIAVVAFVNVAGMFRWRAAERLQQTQQRATPPPVPAIQVAGLPPAAVPSSTPSSAAGGTAGRPASVVEAGPTVAGTQAADGEVFTLDRKPVTLRSRLGTRPTVLISGSFT